LRSLLRLELIWVTAIYVARLGRPQPNFENDDDVRFLVSDGKSLRDGLTHPSPYSSAEAYDQGKIAQIIGINRERVGRLVEAVTDYVGKVEKALGRDETLTIPWMKK